MSKYPYGQSLLLPALGDTGSGIPMKKRKKKDIYRRMSYEQQKVQQSLNAFIPKEVVPWEKKLEERPKPGTPEYKEWWKELDEEQQEKALELRRQENTDD